MEGGQGGDGGGGVRSITAEGSEGNKKARRREGLMGLVRRWMSSKYGGRALTPLSLNLAVVANPVQAAPGFDRSIWDDRFAERLAMSLSSSGRNALRTSSLHFDEASASLGSRTPAGPLLKGMLSLGGFFLVDGSAT
jgi:hypothetical protein